MRASNHLHRWIAHRSPVFVGTVVDPHLKDCRQQPTHHRDAVFQRGAIQPTSTRCGTMTELAAEQIDSCHDLFQDVEPAALDVPTQRLVSAISCFAGGFCGRVFPEVVVEVFVFQDAKYERFVVL